MTALKNLCMKRVLLLSILFLFLIASCKSRHREKQLAQREREVNGKEQELLLKEKTLEFREQELNEKLKRIDSILARDSAAANGPLTDSVIIDSTIIGNWAVKMTCTETTCPGSAIGDVKTEQWTLLYDGNHIVAKASDGGSLVRTYSGLYKGRNIELIEHRDSLVYDTRMVVRLQVINDKTIEGQREIIRDDNCKIVYALQMNKQR